MNVLNLVLAGIATTAASMLPLQAEITPVIERNERESASSAFQFKKVPAPCKNDAATEARLAVVDGRRDRNGGGLETLHDGQVPAEEDQPGACFFFNAGTDGGRILVDLGRTISIRQVNTFSWHAGTRGPQVYVLFGSDGTSTNFVLEPKKATSPDTCGWQRIAAIDARPKQGEAGGQYGVSIADASGSIGKFRYLLFDVSRTESEDAFGNTFFSEIDVLEQGGPAPEFIKADLVQGARDIVEAEGGKFQMVLDTSETPDLTEWARKELIPLMQEWYPKLVKMLPSEGFEAPRKFSIVFKKDMAGVADTAGTRIRAAAKWMRANLKGEAKGAIFHEMVHVVQQYGQVPRGAARAPGWLTEGLTDYIRFYHFEPQTRGAEITKRGLASARYDKSYRVTANFLHYVSEKYDKNFVFKLNTAIREGRYRDDPWKKFTGRTVEQLGEEWKKHLEEKLAA